jgi:hypothetical protein
VYRLSESARLEWRCPRPSTDVVETLPGLSGHGDSRGVEVVSGLRAEQGGMRVVRRGHKFGAVATVFEGVRFASKREAKRYGELLMLGKAGEIADLELQPRFPIIVNGRKVCDYIADFQYYDLQQQRLITEDSKGMRTPVYRLKKKLVEAQYAIEIREV